HTQFNSLCESIFKYFYKFKSSPISQTFSLGMHRYHFFTNRYEYEYFYLCTCRYRVPIPILLRFGLHESAIHLEADFYFILCRLCQAYGTKLTEGYPKPKINRAFWF